MITKMDRFIENIKSYIEISNKKIDFSNQKELIKSLNERNNYYKEVFQDNEKILDDLISKLDSTMSYDTFIEYQNYANKLFTLNEQLDCAVASVIHRKLLNIAKEWNDSNLIIQECYYLSSVYYTFDNKYYINKRIPLYLEINNYKDKYFTLDKKTRELFLKLYGNQSMMYKYQYETDEAMSHVLKFRKEYFDFLDSDEVKNLDPDFKYDIFKYSVDSNISVFISDLRYKKTMSKENFNALKEIIESTYLERLTLGEQTSRPIPANYEQRYYAIKFFAKEISFNEWLEKMRALINRLITNDEFTPATLNSIYFLETIYLTMIYNFSKLNEQEFKKILNEVKSNCYSYLLKIKKDENAIQAYNYYMTFIIGLREVNASPEDIKNSFLNLVRIQNPETYVHIHSVSRISQLILDKVYKKNPSILIGTLGTNDIIEVKSKYDKIKLAIHDGALLHDAGKSSCMLQISNYYRPLTDEEFELIRCHPLKSYEFVYGFFDKPILEIGLYHHLWHNHQGGYPLDIPANIENQALVDIVSIADSIDAATDTIGRSYSDSKNLNELMQELRMEASTRYSKEVLDVFDDELLDKISHLLYDFKYKIYSNIIDTSNISKDIMLLSNEFKVEEFKRNLEIKFKKKKINEEIYKIFLDYIKPPHSVDRIKEYVLSNVNYPDTMDIINNFKKIANLLQDNLGIALSYIFEVWPIYTYDLAKAISLNNKALTYLKKVYDYTKTEVYLSYINNSIILTNASGDLKKSYKIATNAYELSKETSNAGYLAAFSNNYIFVLNELGLYKKSYEIITNNMSRKEIFKTYNNLNNYYIYITVCIGLNRGQEAYKASKKLQKDNNKYHLITQNVVYSCILESLILLKENKAIELAFIDLITYRKEYSEDKMDIYLVYEVLAHYYMYKKDYQNALKYYELFEPYIDVTLGNRKKRYQEQANIYKIIGNKEKYYQYIEKLNDRLDIINEILNDIALETKTDALDKLKDNTYKILFESADKLSNFTKEISTTFDLFKIKKLIENQFLEFINYESLEVYFINENKNYIRVLENSLSEIDLNNELNKFIVSKKEITILSKEKLKSDLKPYFAKNSSQYFVIVPLFNDKEKIGYLTFGISNLTALYRNQNDIRNMFTYIAQSLSNVQAYFKALFNSNIDYQTKVNNRAGLDNRLKKYFEQGLSDYYIIMFDIDSFKTINDRYGHLCGDRVIEDLALKLSNIFKVDNVTRMGGDEFVAIFLGEYKELNSILDKLSQDINETLIEYENEYVSYTVSMGALKFKGFDKFYSGYTLVDDLLYQAKRTGKNKFIIKEN